MVDQKVVRYFPYHKRKGQTLEKCITFIRILNEKHKVGEILLKKSAIMNDLSFPSIGTKAKAK